MVLLDEKVGEPVSAEADHKRDHPDPHHSNAVRQADVAESSNIEQNAKAEGGGREVVELIRVRIVSPHLDEAKDLAADVGAKPENGESTHLGNKDMMIRSCQRLLRSTY